MPYRAWIAFLLGNFSCFGASAFTFFLQQDLGVRGFMHYCKYSNGKIYTVNATDLCAMSIDDAPPGMGQGQGFLQGEFQDGMTKVCVYEVLGQRKALRIGAAQLCPLSPRF